MTIDAVFIYNHKGEVLIHRSFNTAEVKRSIADLFRIHVIAQPNVRSPVNMLSFTGGGAVANTGFTMSSVSNRPGGDATSATQDAGTFFHIRVENLYLVGVTSPRRNANVALVFEWLRKFRDIGRSYFGRFDEEAVRSNFVLVYELLDECLDMGLPQITEAEALKLYITTESVKTDRQLQQESLKITIQTTGATSWRRPDIKYRKNEVYLDVVESVNVLFSNKGTVLKSDVVGQVVMRTYLSGMPECKLGLNDKVVLDKSVDGGNGQPGAPATTSGGSRGKSGQQVELDDIQFHQCVKLGRFDSDRTISFTPPDGEFELMRYRCTNNISLPFKVIPTVNESRTRVEYRVAVKACFRNTLSATNVVIRIPVPSNAAKAMISVPVGKAKYAPGENALVWKIPKFLGDEEWILAADVELSAMVIKKQWARPPITMDFQVMMFTGSGLTVQFLKVFERSMYTSIKWVRYYTKAGTYQFRI